MSHIPLLMVERHPSLKLRTDDGLDLWSLGFRDFIEHGQEFCCEGPVAE